MTLPLPDAGYRVTALVRHNTTLMLREPGPVISRLVQPLVLITLMHPLYAPALAADGAQAGHGPGRHRHAGPPPPSGTPACWPASWRPPARSRPGG